MLLCIPTVKLFRVQQRHNFSSLAKRFSLTGKLPLDPQTQASLDKDFLPWLERIAGSKITDTLTIGKSTYGRSLFASKVIHAGDCILKVPFNACCSNRNFQQITPDELPPDIRVSLADEVGNVGKLAAVLISEKKMGQSRWVPYISRLPQPAEMHSTIFWGEDEFSMIRCSAVHKETLKQKVQIEKEFSFVAQAYKQHCPMVTEPPDLEDFMYAYALVGSRAWETSKGISLIPFADFMNHDRLSASIFISDEEKQLSEVTADRNYSPGDEVFIKYGEFSNATLMLDFGFTLPYNIHDEVQIQMVVPNDDPLRNMKLGLLWTHHTRTVKDINIFHSSCDSFTIKEVKSAIGKGRGIPQSLRAFARVLSCTIPQELNDLSKEAAQNDGRLARLPLKDRSRELEAHKILLSHINRLIEDHSACIKDMEESKCYFGSQRLVVRRQMARDLLYGELRVLRSAAEWLSHYCTALFTETSLYNSNIPMN
ncbi:ribulose-1,5 bisphosphate carboxylase/oxygenase large subunit N-methyltransferase, chloroplastic isoform X2 [Capsella rubella]|uniref:ribulose-1,5 bisphosphate carboxylase/oxygenase large subunit N-methyltransferase, chloroplastic isoform X2 n=1 Tax=Capsella rubella TaxID=81985 RepID=UPI000CD4B4DF|nr:ribulose-1,5 bisphosphate carboxylase/oxygenase large subunit N-methyltransferase, chloroplastic isoform X2 [Capsella rubella]